MAMTGGVSAASFNRLLLNPCDAAFSSSTSAVGSGRGRGRGRGRSSVGECGAVTNSTTTANNNDAPPLPPLLPPRKLKPRIGWSTGTSVGEYGGPPAYVDPEPRRVQFPRDDADPLLSKRDFIWNNTISVESLLPNEQRQPPPPTKPKKEAGFLCLTRAMEIDSLEVDLSQELVKESKKSSNEQTSTIGWRKVPLQSKQLQDFKGRKKTARMFQSTDYTQSTDNDHVAVAAQAKQKYNQLKQNLLFKTLGLGCLGTVNAYILYSPETAASFGFGLFGSLLYIRMLCNNVDSLGTTGLQNSVRNATGQPRLLVPLILTMVHNRWNEILVPEYGFIQLQFIPILLGFFTYKLATFAQTVQELMPTSE